MTAKTKPSADEMTVSELLEAYDSHLMTGGTAYFTTTGPCGCKTRYALAIVGIDTSGCTNDAPPIDPSGPGPTDKLN